MAQVNLKGLVYSFFKGLGHENLGNFSTDQMVIKVTKISQ